jgi:hypothetical protein
MVSQNVGIITIAYTLCGVTGQIGVQILQCACILLYCHLWPACLCHIFSHYVINGKIFGKNMLNTKCVFWFCLQHVWYIFHSEKWARYWCIIKVQYIGLRVKYSSLLSNFKETWILSTYFRKIFKHKFKLKFVQWKQSCSVRKDWRAERQTNVMKLRVAFCNFAYAPKWESWIWLNRRKVFPRIKFYL